jgi:hypothetical protein
MYSNSPDLTKQSDELRTQISSSLEKAQVQKNTLKRNNFGYTTANIIFGAAATLLMGTAGTLGNAATWKPVCWTAAFCSLVATVTAQMRTTEQLTEASECVGQLKALKVETIVPAYDWEPVSEKYQQILSEFATIDC